MKISRSRDNPEICLYRILLMLVDIGIFTKKDYDNLTDIDGENFSKKYRRDV